jgi:hypothetical protein
VKNTKCNVLYLEYAEEQYHAEHHHEELSSDDGKVGDLDTCKKQKHLITGRKFAK